MFESDNKSSFSDKNENSNSCKSHKEKKFINRFKVEADNSPTDLESNQKERRGEKKWNS